ncbi:MAG: hypothetical protein KAG66_17510, partial [Methylococcales bacterium]|nr:hypothetical protein [Methylococcales bacterium]
LASIFFSCNGWDDDSDYAVRTQAVYFVCENGIAGDLRIHEYIAPSLSLDWHHQFGVSNQELSDFSFADGSLWLSAAEQRQLLEIDPATKQVLESHAELPLRPHHFAVGERYILLGDTVDGALAFIKRKNGQMIQAEFEGKPGPTLYNNARFYMEYGDSGMVIYDEVALTPRSNISFANPVIESQFNRYRNVVVSTKDEDKFFTAIVSGVDDQLTAEGFQVNFQQARYTPYLENRYGDQHLENLRLIQNILYSESVPFPDSMRNFEADFFEGNAFFQWKDSLFVYSLAKAEVMDAHPFQRSITRSVIWLGAN